jgi:hypothetical protein
VDVVFDEQGPIGIEAVSWHPIMMGVISPEEQAIISGTPKFGSDSEILPLKAADILAWHVRRDGEERHTMGENFQEREAMRILKEIPFCGSDLSEDFLLKIVAATVLIGGNFD